MAIKPRSSRKFGVSTDDNGDFLEIGPAGTGLSGGVMAIQFVPSEGFVGEFSIQGRLMGQAARDAGVAFMPIEYRPITINNVPKDFTIPTASTVTGPSLIQVPSNGVSVALLVSCSQGTCQIVSWDLQGAFQS